MKILVVDDEPDVIESVRLGFTLQWREVEVLGAATERRRSTWSSGSARTSCCWTWACRTWTASGAAPDPRVLRRAGHDAHGARRRDGQGQGPRAWRRRLRHQAVQPPRAAGPGPGRAAAARHAGAGEPRAVVPGGRPGGGLRGPGGPAARRAAGADADRVQAPLPPRPQRRPRAPARRRCWRRSGAASTSTRSTTSASTSAGCATSWATIRTSPATSARSGGWATGSSARSLLVGLPDPRRVGASTMGACYKRSMDGAIRRLRDVRAGDATEVGGKAARLGELLASGVRVPDGFVLSVADGASAAGDDDPVAALRAAARALGPGPFAVRSSAVGEDGDERSFAGMYESVLGVPDDGLGCRRPRPGKRRGRVLACDRAAGDAGWRSSSSGWSWHAPRVWRSRRIPITGDRDVRRDRRSRPRGAAGVGPAAGDEWVVRGRKATRATEPERAITVARCGASRSRPG